MPDAPKLILDDDWKRSKDPAPVTPPTPPAAAPGLAIDSDWKAQAQAERDRLAAEEQKKAAAQPGGERGKLPPADFPALVGTLITQALMYMGAFPDPETGRAIVSLDHARFHIDLLAVLEAKTKGNLSATEAEEISGAVAELRARFVEISQAVTEAMKKRGPGAAAGGPLSLKFE